MRFFAFALVTLIATLAIATPCFAWGARAHLLIADLAYARLKPSARAGVAALVAQDFSASPGCPIHSFRDAALCSDCVRQMTSYRNQSPWHYDNIPLCGAASYSLYCANGNCATAAIARAQRTLRNDHSSLRDRQRALARLVHFIGDIHQPLHTVNNSDHGGNDVAVRLAWPRVSGAANLHSAWDDALVDFSLDANDAHALSALGTMADRHPVDWTGGTPREWALESHRIAVSLAYGLLPATVACNTVQASPITLNEDYAQRAADVVRTQIGKAGLRLAATLNSIF